MASALLVLLLLASASAFSYDYVHTWDRCDPVLGSLLGPSGTVPCRHRSFQHRCNECTCNGGFWMAQEKADWDC